MTSSIRLRLEREREQGEWKAYKKQRREAKRTRAYTRLRGGEGRLPFGAAFENRLGRWRRKYARSWGDAYLLLLLCFSLLALVEEAKSTPNIDWQDKIRRGILRGLRNISETP